MLAAPINPADINQIQGCQLFYDEFQENVCVVAENIHTPPLWKFQLSFYSLKEKKHSLRTPPSEYFNSCFCGGSVDTFWK